MPQVYLSGLSTRNTPNLTRRVGKNGMMTRNGLSGQSSWTAQDGVSNPRQPFGAGADRIRGPRTCLGIGHGLDPNPNPLLTLTLSPILVLTRSLSPRIAAVTIIHKQLGTIHKQCSRATVFLTCWFAPWAHKGDCTSLSTIVCVWHRPHVFLVASVLVPPIITGHVTDGTRSRRVG